MNGDNKKVNGRNDIDDGESDRGAVSKIEL